MKKLLIIVGVGLLAFALSLAGTYLAMPYIAPDVVAQAQQENDSLAHDEAPLSQQRLMTMLDSLNTGNPQDLFAERAVVNRLRDSLLTMHDSLDAVQGRTSTIQMQLDELRQRISSLEDAQVKAAEISETLTDLDLREMRAVLAPLDLNIYEALYAQTTGRNRTRLLQAMPPDKAAELVDRVVARDAL